MPYNGIQHWVNELEKQNEVLIVDKFVSPVLEISEIADRMVKSDKKALLFKNNGTNFPLLINAFASEKRLCSALGISNIDEPAKTINEFINILLKQRNTLKEKLGLLSILKTLNVFFPKKIKRKGKCQQVIMPKPDLTLLPILKCWPHDGGKFITLPIVHTINPENNIQNVGMYRMQVFSETETGMHWHLHKNSASHFNYYKKNNLKMPVSVILGGDPVYTYCATAPLPENINEYMLAGFLRKKKVKLVKCITNDLYVPEDADFVIEGYVDPNEDLVPEGPFGDHTGFYSLQDYYPKFHVTCITHRKDAVYPTTIVGIPPQEDKWLGLATEKIFMPLIKFAILPEIENLKMPQEGVFHNIVLASIKKTFPGQANKAMNALWGAGQMMFNKILFIFDNNTDLNNYHNLLKIIYKNVNPLEDIVFSKGPADILDHSGAAFAYSSKIGFDATEKKQKNINNPLPFDAENMLLFFKNTKIKHNSTLLKIGFPAAFISLKNKNELNSIARSIANSLKDNVLHYLILVDDEILDWNLSDLAWLCASNIDPERDCFFTVDNNNFQQLPFVIDATSKSSKNDFFDRKWPNILTMDDETIKKIDSKWSELGLGDFLTSPSLKYKSLVKNNSAVAYD